MFVRRKESMIQGEATMKAIGLLNEEHLIIGQMIDAMKSEIGRIMSHGQIDPAFIDTAVDFIENYADGTHHAKEEGILFHRLAGKTMSVPDTEVMQRLIDEHVRARKAASELLAANVDYRAGDINVVGSIQDLLTEFVTFYPPHMQKEEREFFVSCGTYLTKREDERIFSEFMEFDRRLIHEHYRRVVGEMRHK
jgi:hemerythrin-like domain-containing protein